MLTYWVFTRSALNFEQFSKARKTTLARGLSREDAYQMCEDWNAKRTAAHKRKGTKAEFMRE